MIKKMKLPFIYQITVKNKKYRRDDSNGNRELKAFVLAYHDFDVNVIENKDANLVCRIKQDVIKNNNIDIDITVLASENNDYCEIDYLKSNNYLYKKSFNKIDGKFSFISNNIVNNELETFVFLKKIKRSLENLSFESNNTFKEIFSEDFIANNNIFSKILNSRKEEYLKETQSMINERFIFIGEHLYEKTDNISLVPTKQNDIDYISVQPLSLQYSRLDILSKSYTINDLDSLLDIENKNNFNENYNSSIMIFDEKEIKSNIERTCYFYLMDQFFLSTRKYILSFDKNLIVSWIDLRDNYYKLFHDKNNQNKNFNNYADYEALVKRFNLNKDTIAKNQNLQKILEIDSEKLDTEINNTIPVLENFLSLLNEEDYRLFFNGATFMSEIEKEMPTFINKFLNRWKNKNISFDNILSNIGI